LTAHQRRQLRKVRRQSELDAVLDAGDIPLIGGHGLFLVAGDALAFATSGMVDASGFARVLARADAAVRAQACAHIWSEDHVHVDAYDCATIWASGRSCVRAGGESRVFGEERALITVLDNAEAVCRDRVTARAQGRACVHASGQVRVFADGEAAVRAMGAASVCARANVLVCADPNARIVRGGPGVSARQEGEVNAGANRTRLAWRARHAWQQTELALVPELVEAGPDLRRR
jgi:hypothetical protein